MLNDGLVQLVCPVCGHSEEAPIVLSHINFRDKVQRNAAYLLCATDLLYHHHHHHQSEIYRL